MSNELLSIDKVVIAPMLPVTKHPIKINQTKSNNVTLYIKKGRIQKYKFNDTIQITYGPKTKFAHKKIAGKFY